MNLGDISACKSNLYNVFNITEYMNCHYMSDTSLGGVYRYKSTSLFIAHLFPFSDTISLQDIEKGKMCYLSVFRRLFS